MNKDQATTMGLLKPLLGKWQGDGVVEYPTIQTFEYREELEFAANDMQPFLRYEQRTWRKSETGEYAPSHWEVGFWRVLSSNEIEVLNAQGGGRVEVLRGVLTPTSDGFVLHLKSTLVANDPRMAETTREFVLQENRFRYKMEMSLATVPDLTRHVYVELERTSG